MTAEIISFNKDIRAISNKVNNIISYSIKENDDVKDVYTEGLIHVLAGMAMVNGSVDSITNEFVKQIARKETEMFINTLFEEFKKKF